MQSPATAGRSVRRTSRRLYDEASTRAAGAVLLIALGFIIGADGAGGFGACLIGAGLLVAFGSWERARSARRFLLGAIAEERVGSLLWEAERWGWLVEHDVPKPGGGNVDHVIHSPAVTFTVDTKRSSWRPADLRQAHRHADWAARRYDSRRPVVPVVCVQRSDRAAQLIDGVFVVGSGRFAQFLRDEG